ncbi:hypothetical protein BDK51DRAFT_47079 [Blyttiomyces helicus]|uniref:Uncharacterized protein n=1 Tax=Blyttiomyces helicus TaxID=388810 RepID=A0A4P9W3C2_9FUNG|nr:hypothetical protein BDK51DRAFT_47079 [Blyttiomyces helicus]|eukprot:RKO86302.1 hypothetical protein BDK51DRAFT_47079 [Blyttiomyces helicus]
MSSSASSPRSERSYDDYDDIRSPSPAPRSPDPDSPVEEPLPRYHPAPVSPEPDGEHEEGSLASDTTPQEDREPPTRVLSPILPEPTPTYGRSTSSRPRREVDSYRPGEADRRSRSRERGSGRRSSRSPPARSGGSRSGRPEPAHVSAASRREYSDKDGDRWRPSESDRDRRRGSVGEISDRRDGKAGSLKRLSPRDNLMSPSILRSAPPFSVRRRSFAFPSPCPTLYSPRLPPALPLSSREPHWPYDIFSLPACTSTTCSPCAPLHSFALPYLPHLPSSYTMTYYSGHVVPSPPPSPPYTPTPYSYSYNSDADRPSREGSSSYKDRSIARRLGPAVVPAPSILHYTLNGPSIAPHIQPAMVQGFLTRPQSIFDIGKARVEYFLNGHFCDSGWDKGAPPLLLPPVGIITPNLYRERPRKRPRGDINLDFALSGHRLPSPPPREVDSYRPAPPTTPPRLVADSYRPAPSKRRREEEDSTARTHGTSRSTERDNGRSTRTREGSRDARTSGTARERERDARSASGAHEARTSSRPEGRGADSERDRDREWGRVRENDRDREREKERERVRVRDNAEREPARDRERPSAGVRDEVHYDRGSRDRDEKDRVRERSDRPRADRTPDADRERRAKDSDRLRSSRESERNGSRQRDRDDGPSRDSSRSSRPRRG